MIDKDHCIRVCNELLRGERAAVETYTQAIEKYSDEPMIDELRRIRDEHKHAVSELEENVIEMGGIPKEDSGVWGSFVSTIQGSANLFGKSSALTTLRKGEEFGRTSYNQLLADDDVMHSCKELVATDLLPRVQDHILTLEDLVQAQAA